MSTELEELKKEEERGRRRSNMVIIAITTMLAACAALLYFVPLGGRQQSSTASVSRSAAAGRASAFTGSKTPTGGGQGAGTEASEKKPAENNREQHTQASAAQTQANETQPMKSTGQKAALVQELSQIFGEVDNASMYSDGVYRLEYRTNMRTRNEIQREVFNMTRKVRNICRCENIIITAIPETGQKLLAHSTQETSTRTLSGFLSQANVVWVEN
ncbi:MAG: hypothetical protein LBU70_03925 [Chitinispirillales bacterium]|jgi:flagellar basal body-associated protein FliL|nr:hypothetical protein [Chitinispirillales bacterium]